MDHSGGIENPIFEKMVSSIPSKVTSCRSLASDKPFIFKREVEVLARSANPDFERSHHPTTATPKSQPLQIPHESKKDIKESPRSRFPMNIFSMFRKVSQRKIFRFKAFIDKVFSFI